MARGSNGLFPNSLLAIGVAILGLAALAGCAPPVDEASPEGIARRLVAQEFHTATLSEVASDLDKPEIQSDPHIPAAEYLEWLDRNSRAKYEVEQAESTAVVFVEVQRPDPQAIAQRHREEFDQLFATYYLGDEAQDPAGYQSAREQLVMDRYRRNANMDTVEYYVLHFVLEEGQWRLFLNLAEVRAREYQRWQESLQRETQAKADLLAGLRVLETAVLRAYGYTIQVSIRNDSDLDLSGYAVLHLRLIFQDRDGADLASEDLTSYTFRANSGETKELAFFSNPGDFAPPPNWSGDRARAQILDLDLPFEMRAAPAPRNPIELALQPELD